MNYENPPSEFRGIPFWAWNGKLDPETLRQQIRSMKEAGLGGFFMHSRTGLQTPYLSEEWFRAVEACIDEAESLGMSAWLYDEDRWPSGAGGGFVTKNHAFRARPLAIHICPEGKLPVSPYLPEFPDLAAALSTLHPVALFAGRLSGLTLTDLRSLPVDAVPELHPGETLFICHIEVGPDDPWYNGQAYLDTLNPEATREFIRITHEAYAKRLGTKLGSRTVPGIFTDEPNHPGLYNSEKNAAGELICVRMAWTDRMPEYFQKRCGCDLLPRLLELPFDVPPEHSSASGTAACPTTRLRYDFARLVGTLFVENFIQPIARWCEENGCLLTGHLLCEDSLLSQSLCVGSCMVSYEYMQAPGMDLLTETWRVFQTAKQLSSAAHQFGKTWRLSEMYGTTGWDFPLCGHKALGDWQAALGINLRCQHLMWYTMQSQAKRDYPASIFFHSPWWKEYRVVEDYFARVNAALSEGEEQREILFLHPLESLWPYLSAGFWDTKSIFRIENDFTNLTEALLSEHLDFDYGDEDILARHGSVEQSRTNEAPRLRVAKASYKAVVIPSLTTIRSSTLELLKTFAQAGGQVLFTGALPALVDALPNASAAGFAASAGVVTPQKCVEILSGSLRRVSIAESAAKKEFLPALYQLRETENEARLFICNTGENYALPEHTHRSVYGGNPAFEQRSCNRREACSDVTIRYTGEVVSVTELDLASGSEKEVQAVRTPDGCAWRTSFPALASRLYFLRKHGTAALLPAAEPPAPPEPPPRITIPLPEVFSPRPDELNPLVLDHPQWRVAEEPWQEECEILRIDDALRDRLGLQHRYGHMKQPWLTPPIKNPRRLSLQLRYRFHADFIPQDDLFLSLEAPENFRFLLNGVPLSTTQCAWWIDPCVKTLRLENAALRLGENILEAQCDFTENFSGLEIMYLRGNFGVRLDPDSGEAMPDRFQNAVITAPPERIVRGDLCAQGYPFYSGNMTYVTRLRPQPRNGKRIVLSCGRYDGSAVAVSVNGHRAGFAAWDPHEFDLTDYLPEGEDCELAITLFGSRRNSHGPLHHYLQWPEYAAPGTFAFQPGKPHEWKNAYNLVPFGLH